jgi:hypothetical protein
MQMPKQNRLSDGVIEAAILQDAADLTWRLDEDQRRSTRRENGTCSKSSSWGYRSSRPDGR